MSDFLAQLILARRSEDTEKWTNILFVVVLAVFWALSGILKTRAKKTQQGGTGPSRGRPVQSRAPQERSVRQAGLPAGQAGRRTYQSSIGQARSRLAELRTAAQKFAAEAEQAFRVQIQQSSQEVPPAVYRPVGRPEPGELLESLAKLPAAPQPEDLPLSEDLPQPEEAVPSEYLSQLLSAYADPDQLRGAILHFEILGKPLALRDPQDSGAEL